MTKEYWKKRCELAEKYIKETPCDPDIYKEQMIAYNNWMEFKKFPIPDVVVPKGTLCDHPEDMRHGTGYLECQYCIKCGKEIV